LGGKCIEVSLAYLDEYSHSKHREEYFSQWNASHGTRCSWSKT
jgi:hypothetical protein